MFVNMKKFISLLMLLIVLQVDAQKVDFTIHNISLPSEISYYDNQFSGLYINNDKLFLMSESRLQDKAEAKLYAIQIKDIEKKLVDTSFILPFRKIPIYYLEILREKMKAKGDEYEGLEAMVIDKNQIYFSVETATPSNNCYLLKGIINDTAIILDETQFITLAKPTDPNGKHIYNAGFEAIVKSKKSILSFFEYNYFNDCNVVKNVDVRSFSLKNDKSFSIQKLPFRITDITSTGKYTFTAINYFYNGSGEDEIYRVPANDTTNHRLIYDKGSYKSYARLVSIKRKNGTYTWKSLWEFPKSFWNYNWEGLTSYKKGYFLINDKYTAFKPYSSILLYAQFTK